MVLKKIMKNSKIKYKWVGKWCSINNLFLVLIFYPKNPKSEVTNLWMPIIPDIVFINRTYKNESDEFLNQSDDSAFKPIRW